MSKTSVFAGLHPDIQRVLSSKEIHQPTEPQAEGIPPILDGKNVLLIAPTGLGKTESALLPIFHNFMEKKANNTLYKEKNNGISILYITPLRALNRDMLQRTFDWGKQLGIDIAVRHGDTTRKERSRQSKHPPDMLITTPETLQILFTGKRLREHLKTVQWVVVDEIHELAEDERGTQLSIALERLFELTQQEDHGFQRVGLSATVGSPVEVARFLGGVEHDDFRDVTTIKIDVTKHIDIAVELPTVEKNDYKLAGRLSIEPTSFASLRRCLELIDDHQSTLFFVNTRDSAEILASRFHQWKKNVSIGVHHGSLSKDARIESEDAFKEGKLKSLICTSSLELGIDVGHTDFVIQYNSPRQVTRLLQRVGRSGHRIGETSEGKIIVTNPEDLAEGLVLARRSLQGELEAVTVREKPLSVLANQVISIALEYRTIYAHDMFAIICRSYPFYQLRWVEFKAIVDQLFDQHSIWVKEKEDGLLIGKKRRSREYFLDNISMIPDEETCPVIDISTRKQIGVLDESFVLNTGFEGARFILRGEPWTVVKREEEGLLVRPDKEIGAVPSWVGEDIPVPFEVAQEVGRLRRLAAEHRDLSAYPCDKTTLQSFLDHIRDQKEKEFVVPDDQTLTIEADSNNVVINACFGSKVNETIGRVISAVLAQSIGESIGVNTDPYRIQLELPRRVSVDKVEEILMTVKPESVPYVLRRILRNSTFIRWHLIHVARKFGALRKDFDYKKVGAHRLVKLFEQNPVFDEAIDKLIWDRMDVADAQEVFERIQSGEISMYRQRLSPIGLAGYEAVKGFMIPQRPDRTILRSLEKRLENTDVAMMCVNCNHQWRTHVGRVDEQPRCPNCDAIRIAVVKKYNRDLFKVLTKKERSAEEKKEAKRLLKNASLVLSYGRYAVLALMGRGVGPDTASRILSRFSKQELRKSDEERMRFLKAILKAELTYARTRGFWDGD